MFVRLGKYVINLTRVESITVENEDDNGQICEYDNKEYYSSTVYFWFDQIKGNIVSIPLSEITDEQVQELYNITKHTMHLYDMRRES